MSDLYFAYGSNLKTERMKERIPSAMVKGISTLRGYQFKLNKLGKDGSAKANIAPIEGGIVYGVAYSFGSDQWSVLDSFEGGYKRVPLKIHILDQFRIASTYICVDTKLLVESIAPSNWYLNLIIEGATQHSLPYEYLSDIKAKFGNV